jgi:hypothetical protein
LRLKNSTQQRFASLADFQELGSGTHRSSCINLFFLLASKYGLDISDNLRVIFSNPDSSPRIRSLELKKQPDGMAEWLRQNSQCNQTVGSQSN